MKKVLITGATGFVGGHLVRAAVDRGWSVRALVRASSHVSELESLGVECFTGDLTQPRSLDGCCDGVEAVLHAACAVAATFDAGRDAERRFLEVNRDGTVNLAREVLEHRGLRLVHLSSTAAMGNPGTSHVDETAPCNPRTPYQVSKREAELALLELHQTDDLSVVILRPCLVAGEGKAGGELLRLFRLVRKGRFPLIGSNAEIQKPLLMVDDLVEAVFLAAERGRAGEIYLVHSDGGHTLGQILETAGHLTGARRTHFRVPLIAARAASRGFRWLNRLLPDWNPPLTPERIDLFITDRRIDMTKARDELGFSPQHQDLDEMLGRTYRWYLEQGSL